MTPFVGVLADRRLGCAVVGSGSPCPAARAAVEHRFHMDANVIIAVLGVVIVAACPAFFIVGRKAGGKTEIERQGAAKATAEESSKRIVGEAEREAENLRKSEVVSGWEEVFKRRAT